MFANSQDSWKFVNFSSVTAECELLIGLKNTIHVKKIFIQNSTLYLEGKNGAAKIANDIRQEKKDFTLLDYMSKTDLLQHVSRLC